MWSALSRPLFVYLAAATAATAVVRSCFATTVVTLVTANKDDDYKDNNPRAIITAVE